MDMVMWNYRVIRHTYADGEDFYAIHEVYYEKDGITPSMWSETEMGVGADTVAGLHNELDRMRLATTKPVLVIVGDKLVQDA